MLREYLYLAFATWPTKTETWTRDNKMGNDYFIDPFPYQHVTNLMDRQIEHFDGTIDDYSYTSVYEYDTDDYPIKQTKTYHSGMIEELTFEYYPVE